MIAVVVSRRDQASTRIGRHLLGILDWSREADDLYQCESRDLVAFFIPDTHLYHDHVDRELRQRGYDPAAVVFASRHASESGRRTLSVHPVGNYGSADFGGRAGTLVPSAPLLMSQALRYLRDEAQELPYTVCYEVTHHGPYLETPAMFIEVGSTSREWSDDRACSLVAAAIARLEDSGGDMVAVGLGGGHYAPRFTDVTLGESVAFGHMIPRYHFKTLYRSLVHQAVEATPGSQAVYVHGDQAARFLPWFSEKGLAVVQ
ncbi:MAG: D-aminoacyl-tRNA deacylase [Candidatus Thermoplasmatota archaeon]|nr:D-aminoacyl-tRNA deacylase [Candidatus Thermoplasmatota archaeon]